MKRLFMLSAVFLLASSLAHADTGSDDERIPVPAQASDVTKPPPKFRILYGSPARWNGPLRWRYNHRGAPPPFAADAAGTLAQINAAFQSWTASCGITFVYEGETTVAPNARVQHPRFGEQPDEINVVGWGELDGTLAGATWVWYREDASGREWMDADIKLSGTRINSWLELTRVGVHEWGHALGLDHSNVEAAIMSGPPSTTYNALLAPQPDDIRGCRCLYGPAAGQLAGYACSLPEKLELGIAATGSASAPQSFTLRNDGNAPLVVRSLAASSARVVHDHGCPPGIVLAPGQSCAVSVVGRPSAPGPFEERLTIDTSDGGYVLPVSFTGTASGSPTTVQLVEYRHAAFDHYFVTHLAAEIAALDDGTYGGWQRTGRTMHARAQADAGLSPVCRFFSERFAPRSSHFYTSFAHECTTVKGNPSWTFEGEVFHVALPDAQGACAAGTVPVFRLYNNGRGGAPNHRLTTDPADRAQMIAQGWTPEGAGAGVTMCVPL